MLSTALGLDPDSWRFAFLRCGLCSKNRVLPCLGYFNLMMNDLLLLGVYATATLHLSALIQPVVTVICPTAMIEGRKVR